MIKYIRTENGLDKMTAEQYEAYKLSKQPEKTYLDNRVEAYGSIIEQIEFITENGLEAWQQKVSDIKAEFPKED